MVTNVLNMDNKNRVIYALALAIELKFDLRDWNKRGYEIDENETIEEHKFASIEK